MSRRIVHARAVPRSDPRTLGGHPDHRRWVALPTIRGRPAIARVAGLDLRRGGTRTTRRGLHNVAHRALDGSTRAGSEGSAPGSRGTGAHQRGAAAGGPEHALQHLFLPNLSLLRVESVRASRVALRESSTTVSLGHLRGRPVHSSATSLRRGNCAAEARSLSTLLSQSPQPRGSFARRKKLRERNP